MNRTKTPGCSKPIVVQLPVMLTVYAVVFGLVALLHLWAPTRLVKDFANSSIGGIDTVRTFGAYFLLAACCAASLAAFKDAQLQRRGLFWFATAHTAVWLAILSFASWPWRPGIGDSIASVAGTMAWLLFAGWLSAEGEFPQTPYGKTGFFSLPASTASEPLRSQYEQKIRQAAAQEERNRLARDLHDSIKQQIFAIQTAAATAQVRFEGNSSGAREALDQIRASAREAMIEMEVMLDQLRAEPLEHTGLVEALKKLCETIGFRTGAHVDFKLGEIPPAGAMAPGAAEATLRAAQEALANVARHARASHVFVSLDSAESRLRLTVTDDGAGFNPEQDSRGMGTANMRTRAEELGGKFELVSRPAQGTTVKFSIPYAASTPAGTRRQYRNRAIGFALFFAAVIFNQVAHHWIVLPAVAFVAGLSVIHYVKSGAGVRRLSGTAA